MRAAGPPPRADGNEKEQGPLSAPLPLQGPSHHQERPSPRGPVLRGPDSPTASKVAPSPPWPEGPGQEPPSLGHLGVAPTVRGKDPSHTGGLGRVGVVPQALQGGLGVRESLWIRERISTCSQLCPCPLGVWRGWSLSMALGLGHFSPHGHRRSFADNRGHLIQKSVSGSLVMACVPRGLSGSPGPDAAQESCSLGTNGSVIWGEKLN